MQMTDTESVELTAASFIGVGQVILHAGCAAGVEQLSGPSINRSVVNSSQDMRKYAWKSKYGRSVCWLE